jgi:hypothetical protein
VFCFRRKRIEKRRFDYTRNSYRNEFTDFPSRSYSHARLVLLLVLSLSSFIDLTIAHMILVHERTTLCLDALVMAHVLIMVIVSHVGMAFLLGGLTLTLSPDTWMVHAFPIMIHIPLIQTVRCNCKYLLMSHG